MKFAIKRKALTQVKPKQEAPTLRDFYKFVLDAAKGLQPGEAFSVELKEWAKCVPEQTRKGKASDRSLDAFADRMTLALERAKADSAKAIPSDVYIEVEDDGLAICRPEPTGIARSASALPSEPVDSLDKTNTDYVEDEEDEEKRVEVGMNPTSVNVAQVKNGRLPGAKARVS